MLDCQRLSAVFSSSGGYRYHWKALRYRHQLWRPFRHNLAQWLEKATPPKGEIVFLGASGGYLLEPSYVQRFAKVTAIDPDPLARWIFRRRHRESQAQWLQVMSLLSSSPQSLARALGELRQTYPQAFFLFTNLWGQLAFLKPKSVKLESLFWQLKLSLSGPDWYGRWASFHDFYSFTTPAGGSLPPTYACQKIFLHEAQKAKITTMTDHQTSEAFSDFVGKEYFLWTLEPRCYHLIEGVSTF